MSRSPGMELERPREKIGDLRQDVVVAADTDDPPAPLQIVQPSGHFRKGGGRKLQGTGDGGRRHGFPAHEGKNQVFKPPIPGNAPA